LRKPLKVKILWAAFYFEQLALIIVAAIDMPVGNMGCNI
jgi:hypothetical protein